MKSNEYVLLFGSFASLFLMLLMLSIFSFICVQIRGEILLRIITGHEIEKSIFMEIEIQGLADHVSDHLSKRISTVIWNQQ